MKDQATPSSPRRVLLAGVALVLVFGLIMLTPLLMGLGSLNRYVVAFGLIGVLLGGSFILHGSWDWLAARRRR